jgi:predicted secreted protein
MTKAITGVGALMRYYTGSAWASIGEVTNISGPSMSKDMHDVTSLASLGGYREFIVGFKDPGNLTFTMWFNRADYEAMKDLFESDDLQDFELIMPDSEHTTLEFSGYVTELPLEVPEGPVSCNVTIKISGSVTINSGTHSGPLA